MVFSSLLFLFLYLPATLLIYFIVPRKARNWFLLFVNLIFYGWGEPLLVLLMVANVLINYVGGLLVDYAKRRNKRLAIIPLIATIVIDIGTLMFFKYSGMIADTINYLTPLNIKLPEISLPLGISFYTFQTMSYVIDVYRDDAPVSLNPVNFGTYVTLFPQLIAGPIVRYKDVAHQLMHRKETLEQFNNGVKLFIVGLGKKVLIADQMGMMWESIRATTDQNGVLGSWIGIAAYALQIYFDFSGYSDMARGLGNMLGFEFLKNFDYPYISKSVTEFWRRWHISLSTWFKEYLYIPLGGNRKGIPRQIINLLIVWFLTGLWHGAAYNFILWGLYYGIILIIEKFLIGRFLEKLPNAIKHIYTVFIFLIGWVIFSFDDMSQMGSFFGELFNFTNGLIGHQALVILCRYAVIFAAAIVASTPLGKNIYYKIKDMRFTFALETLYCAAVMIISTASLVTQSYHPFLYFRF